MIKEHERVVLARDLPEYGLVREDVGVVVHVYKTGAYEVEFVALDGATIAVVTLDAPEVRPVRRGEVPSARALQRVA